LVILSHLFTLSQPRLPRVDNLYLNVAEMNQNHREQRDDFK